MLALSAIQAINAGQDTQPATSPCGDLFIECLIYVQRPHKRFFEGKYEDCIIVCSSSPFLVNFHQFFDVLLFFIPSNACTFANTHYSKLHSFPLIYSLLIDCSAQYDIETSLSNEHTFLPIHVNDDDDNNDGWHLQALMTDCEKFKL